MELLLKYLKGNHKELIESFGGTNEDISYYTDEDGNEIMVVSDEIAKKMMQSIADTLVAQGLWTEEEAQDYLEHGSDE